MTLEDLFQQLSDEAEEENIRIIDSRFEDLSYTIGRKLSCEEEAAILDIVDQYTPKGSNGNYLYPLIPFDYAWQIYRIKNS